MANNNDDRVSLMLGMIAKRAQDRGCQLTKTRLVKFLYLLDLFWAQHTKATFTGWPWAFVHYGPYCRESTDAIDRAEQRGFLAAQAYESARYDADFRLYKAGERFGDYEDQSTQDGLPFYVSGRLFSDISRWCDDTHGLLNYIYFGTEPMKKARPGDRLSFEGVEKPDQREFRALAIAPLSDQKKKTFRQIIDRMKADNAKARPAAPADLDLYDDVYDEFIAKLGEGETPVGVTGSAEIKVAPVNDD